jgi:hypothetical protein
MAAMVNNEPKALILDDFLVVLGRGLAGMVPLVL